MHASLTAQPSLTTDVVEENVSLFGEADSYETEPRLSVRVTLSLRFFDMVGLLAFHPSMMLTTSDLQRSDALAEALRFTIVDADASQIEGYAELARTALSSPRQPVYAYAKLVAEAVTRTFGITAPQPPAVPAVNTRLFAAA
ncbi:hypothetical protein ACGF13_31705 [Kitasatospora sp. NPDC048286]|uniref:hypothetical protein n=1 Tax=Kitasatospora sp. NPDC048286 TaxID=3364047 RepID=UPI003715A58C